MKLRAFAKTTRDDYLELIKQFPLRVIRNERELDAAIKVALRLAAKGEAELSEGEAGYLDVLDRLIEDYEETYHGMPRSDATPLERLRDLVNEAGLSASDLGRLLGNRSLGSLLMTGRRELSKAHIRVLAEHFKVNAGYFL
jgi:HTH-type transcriptional regulator / antitoxin HigA